MTDVDMLISFDVESLLTKVPIEKALDVIGRKPPDTTLSNYASPRPTSCGMMNTMNRLMELQWATHCPQLLLRTSIWRSEIQSAMVKPKTWLHYVDDTFVIWSGDKEEPSMF